MPTIPETSSSLHPNAPSFEILEAFEVASPPELLPGGQNTCFLADKLVLKPAGDSQEASWMAELNSQIDSPDFRIQKFKPAKDGSWVFDGWTASYFLEGSHHKITPENSDKNTTSQIQELINLSQAYHQHLVKVPKPAWFNQKDDIFAVSDRMAWGETELPYFEPVNAKLTKLVALLKENHLPFQLVHGDWGSEQILFHDTLPPAIIDMTPYFRPADYPIADMLEGMLAYQGASPEILHLGDSIPDFQQLMLRSILMRACTYIGFQLHPENDQDRAPSILRHLDLVDLVMKYTK